MSLDIIILCITLSCMFIALFKEWLLPEFIIFLALSSLILTGILSPDEALKGFSNPAVHTVALLFIFGAAISKSGILDDLVHSVLKSKKNFGFLLVRMMLPVSTISAFMNNTPLVAMLIPSIQKWSLLNNIKPSKLLIPLSYAAILGGTITLIGTSTNLIIQGLLIEKELSGFRFFEFAYFGIPLTIAGILYFATVGHILLPNRTPNMLNDPNERSKYIFCYLVEKNSPLIGKTIVEAMLRNLNQLFLIQIYRGGKSISPAPNDEVIQSEDILIFSGNPKGALPLVNTLD
ncbi:SLC13 family permease [Bacillus haimaensis]|uniref:SLC13 family permease n=1 Tax=Bacillus haimaensis TaxID=3160967 RepID=UPI003AA88399